MNMMDTHAGRNGSVGARGLVAWAWLAAGAAGAAEFAADWQGTRTWTGRPAGRTRADWRVEDGELVGDAARNRTVHCLAYDTGAAPTPLRNRGNHPPRFGETAVDARQGLGRIRHRTPGARSTTTGMR
jgi:hypothetical protein